MDLDALDLSIDRSDFLGSLQAKGAMLGQGHAAGAAHGEGLDPDGLLFVGMGFSGVTSNLVKDAATRVLDVPFSIVKHYQFPRHVKQDWHTLAISYSGETEETLSVVRESKARGIGVTCLSTGGTLADLADHNIPQPAGHQPRAAVAHTWFSVLGFLEANGLLAEGVPVDDAVQAVRAVDAQCGPDVPSARNPAKRLAVDLVDHIPQIYATPAFYGVGLHFRGMLNENAKKIADVDLVPECNHNDFTGWGGDPMRRHFAVVALSHEEQNPEIMRRLAFMRQRYESWGVPWHHEVFPPIHSFQEHVVAQARSMQMLDYVSFYVAMLRGVDPSEIKEIRALKEFLRG